VESDWWHSRNNTDSEKQTLGKRFVAFSFCRMSVLFMHILLSSYSATFSFPFKTIYFRDFPFVISLRYSTLVTGETKYSRTEKKLHNASEASGTSRTLLPSHWLHLTLVSKVVISLSVPARKVNSVRYVTNKRGPS
jgi:hypothetical protein